MKPLDAIFFDIDDTLFSTSEFAALARRSSVRAMIAAGLEADEEQCYSELMEVIREFGANSRRHFEKLLFRYPLERLGRVNPAIIIASGVVAYHQTKNRELRPYPDVEEAFSRLSGRGVRIGIISAGLAAKQAEKLVRLGLLRYIDPRAIFITDQLGIGKPNPKLYSKCCQFLRLEPGRCIHMGDSPLNDIDPAAAVGMTTILNRRAGKYLREEGVRRADYEIDDMHGLLEILRRDFGVHIPAPSDGGQKS